MSSNLSELSVQLRKLQADKTAQANEIDRLGRSLLVHLYVVLVLLTSHSSYRTTSKDSLGTKRYWYYRFARCIEISM